MDLRSPSLFFVRHAQSCGNVSHSHSHRSEFPNAELSEHGKQQAVDASRYFRFVVPVAKQPRIVLASVLVRSIQTAVLMFPDATVFITPIVREYVFSITSRPDSLEQLQRTLSVLLTPAQLERLRYDLVDAQELTDISRSKASAKTNWRQYWYGRQNVARLLEDVTKPLDPGEHVAVVSHGAFLNTTLPGSPTFANTAVWCQGRFVYGPLDVSEAEDAVRRCRRNRARVRSRGR